MAFKLLKSTQNLSPSFLSITTTGKLQGNSDLPNMPVSNMSLTDPFTSALLWRHLLHGFNLIGAWSPVLIFIFSGCVYSNSLSETTTTYLLYLSCCPTRVLNFTGAIIYFYFSHSISLSLSLLIIPYTLKGPYRQGLPCL